MDETISLRDQLAMAALQVVAGGTVQPDRRARERIARAAYDLADSLLEARAIDPAQLKLLNR